MESSHEFDFEIVGSRIRPIADELVAKYDELRHIQTDMILFVCNHKSGGSKKRIVLAKTARVPEKWRDFLFQLGACAYSHMIEYYAKTTACLDENQMIALTYRQLLLISPEGGIQTPDTNEWWHILTGLGRRWFYPDATCPCLLDENIDWKKLMGDRYEPVRTME